MYLGMVRVQNFRNLEDITVFLKPGLNVLVGENNVGKSNLLDALRWALGVQSVGRDAAVLLDKEDRHRKPDGTYLDAPIHVELRFEGLSSDDSVEFLEILNFDEADKDKSTATIHCEPAGLGRSLRDACGWHRRAGAHRQPVRRSHAGMGAGAAAGPPRRNSSPVDHTASLPIEPIAFVTLPAPTGPG